MGEVEGEGALTIEATAPQIAAAPVAEGEAEVAEALVPETPPQPGAVDVTADIVATATPMPVAAGAPPPTSATGQPEAGIASEPSSAPAATPGMTPVVSGGEQATTVPTAENGEDLGVESPAAAGGSTGVIWRVLEGVFGGIALLLVAGVLWRVRRRSSARNP